MSAIAGQVGRTLPRGDIAECGAASRHLTSQKGYIMTDRPTAKPSHTSLCGRFSLYIWTYASDRLCIIYTQTLPPQQSLQINYTYPVSG